VNIKELITDFSESRPKAEIIVGYGSKVKTQANDKGTLKQIDLIFGVNNSLEWHRQNYEMNPNDYKSKLGYSLLPKYKDLGTEINYISYIPFENHMFKIGVVDTNDLILDLINWHNFFLAGRFQKPIEVIKGNETLDRAISLNRMNALKISLLASGKEIISEKELYETLCSLSFIGDWRRILHIETKDKVKNIVEGSFEEFQTMYSQFNDGFYEIKDDGSLIINYENLFKKLNTLPTNLKQKVIECLFNEIDNMDSEILIKIKETIIKHFANINLRVTAAQPVKGLILNGTGKSLTYINQKLSKK